MTALLVALGGALGAVCRHLVTTSMRSRLGATSAGAVLTINASGSLVLGLVAGAAPGWLLPLVGVGFCGAYTTFATHAVEVVLNLALGLGLATLGWVAAS